MEDCKRRPVLEAIVGAWTQTMVTWTRVFSGGMERRVPSHKILR